MHFEGPGAQKFEGHLSALHMEECASVAEEEMTIHWAVFVVEGNISKLLEEHAIHQALSLLSGAWQHLLWVKDLFLAAWEPLFQAFHWITPQDIDDITVVTNLVKIIEHSLGTFDTKNGAKNDG